LEGSPRGQEATRGDRTESSVTDRLAWRIWLQITYRNEAIFVVDKSTAVAALRSSVFHLEFSFSARIRFNSSALEGNSKTSGATTVKQTDDSLPTDVGRISPGSSTGGRI
jgi:hypothetical protein